jgi:alpha-beta hydrolase superfamily lysophospholipase
LFLNDHSRKHFNPKKNFEMKHILTNLLCSGKDKKSNNKTNRRIARKKTKKKAQCQIISEVRHDAFFELPKISCTQLWDPA